jgi:hypothetical protein
MKHILLNTAVCLSPLMLVLAACDESGIGGARTGRVSYQVCGGMAHLRRTLQGVVVAGRLSKASDWRRAVVTAPVRGER